VRGSSYFIIGNKPDWFTIAFLFISMKNYRETTRLMAAKALEKFTHPAFLVAAVNLETDAEELLHGFEDIVGKNVNVFGGMAGDDMQFTGQYVCYQWNIK
jgi:hypothetical protein